METLLETINWIETVAEDDEFSSTTLVVEEPWGLTAAVRRVRCDDAGRLPTLQQGFTYFLEAAVAREVLACFRGKAANEPEIAASLLLYYARHDAYPDWANRRFSAINK